MADDTSRSDDRLNAAAMMRAAADNELCSHDERRLEAHLEENPQDVSRIKAEQELRAAVGRVMSVDDGEGAPAGLRDRIASAMAAVDLDESAPVHDQSVPEQMAFSTRSKSFWAGTQTRVIAVAAVVLIAVTLIWFNNSVPLKSQARLDRTVAARFVANEHGHCVTDVAHAEKKFKIENPEDLATFAGKVVGKEIALADLIAGGASDISFVDAGPCRVPGGGPSMHLRFRLPDHTDTVSLFIQEANGRMEFEEGTTYEVVAPQEAPNSPSVYIWSREGLNYYLVIESPEDADVIQRSLAVPERSQVLTGSA